MTGSFNILRFCPAFPAMSMAGRRTLDQRVQSFQRAGD
jgi:hypothetical protein